MTFLPRHAIAVTLVLCSAVFSGRAQSQTRTPRKGSIAGKVTLKGKAAPGVTIGLRPTNFSPFEPVIRTTTDLEGKYLLNDIPAGNYQVIPTAPGFVMSGDNNARGQVVVLGEGENIDGIDFTLVRGGVITGKVTDADGRPVVEQRVYLLPADQLPNQRRSFPVSNAQTDDRGIYRMFGLAAGRFKVAVGQSQENFFGSVSSGRPSYKETFHPDVTDPTKATVIEVNEGGEASNVDIAVGRPSQTFMASGRVINGENSQPIADVRFGLQLVLGGQQSGAFIGTLTISNSQGDFKIENLAPGKYAVFILPQKQNSEIRGDAVTFEIVDQDVSGLVIKTSKGISLAGNVVLENTDDKAIVAKLAKLQINGFSQSETASGNIGHVAEINSDGSFILNGLEAGIAHLSLGASEDSMLTGFTVVRIERDGVVQPRGIEIKNGDQISGVRVVISYGSAIVHGTVRLENGTLPAGARILLRVKKVGEVTSNLRPPTVDTRGHFIVDGLPAGTYEFAASVFVPGASSSPPRANQQVTVADDVVTELTITIDLNQKRVPPSP